MTCTRLLALETTPHGIQLDNTLVSAAIFPIGINLLSLNEKRFTTTDAPTIAAALAEKYSGKKIVIGRDKNDYVKGVRVNMIASMSIISAYFHTSPFFSPI